MELELPLGKCAVPESPPQALGAGETSSSYQLQSRCVHWLPGQSTTFGSECHIWNSQCGSHCLETINPEFTWGLQHRLSILFTSRPLPGPTTGSLQTSRNTT